MCFGAMRTSAAISFFVPSMSAVLPMPDPFASAKAMFRRAHHHINDLEVAVENFGTQKPYTTVVEYDPGFGKHLLKARFIESVVEDVACIMFDAISNLRACLDQMTYAIALRHRGDNENFAYFPFAKDLAHWPNRINGMNKDLPDEIRALFATFKAYKGGDDTLWALGHIANVKKHAVLVPVGFGVGAMLSFPNGLPATGKFISTPPELYRKDEIVIMELPEGHAVPEINLSPTVRLAHTDEVIDGQQPVSFIDGMRSVVASVCGETESCCLSIGLFK